MQKYLYQDLANIEKTHWWHINKRKIVTKTTEKYFPNKKIKSLDIGCGTGSLVKEMAEYGTSWGLDPSNEAIKICKQNKIKNIKKSKAENTPFKNNTFDLVSALDVLEHADDKNIIKETNRILKNQGLFVITVPAYPWLWSKWDDELMHKRRYFKKDIEHLLINNNFNIIKSTYQHSFLVPPVFIIRKIKDIIYSPKNYPSDFLLSNRLINKILMMVSDYELKISEKINIPFGLSVMLIAQKYEKV